MDEEAHARAFGTALRQQSKNVVYPDYKVKNDFTVWLKGYREKIRYTFHYTAAQDTTIDAEVVRSISGKLESGPALDAYERLEDAAKTDYEQLVKCLTEEYLDPQEKRKFIENFSYNKRKKGQSIKEFMHEIIKDMNRYSGIPDGTPKEKEGVRRFKNGIRDERGRKDSDLKTHMRFHTYNDADLTWEKALDAALRWENAKYKTKDSESSSSSSDSEEEVKVKVEAVAERSKMKPKKKSGAILAAVEQDGIAILADQVKANTMDIKGMKTEQERASVELRSFRNEVSTNLSTMMQELKSDIKGAGFQQQQQQPQAQRQQPQQQQQQQHQSQQSSRPNFRNFTQNRNPQQGSNIGPQQRQNFQQRSPQNYTWKGKFNQMQQTGFGLQRSSPTTFPKTATNNGTTAAVEEEEMAENLEDEEETVTMTGDDFRKLTAIACYDVEADEIVAACQEVNFP